MGFDDERQPQKNMVGPDRASGTDRRLRVLSRAACPVHGICAVCVDGLRPDIMVVMVNTCKINRSGDRCSAHDCVYKSAAEALRVFYRERTDGGGFRDENIEFVLSHMEQVEESNGFRTVPEE